MNVAYIIERCRTIPGWWCNCPIGSRCLGCCSHVPSAIRFLSYQRWQSQQHNMESAIFMNLDNDALQCSDSDDSSDNDSDHDQFYFDRTLREKTLHSPITFLHTLMRIDKITWNIISVSCVQSCPSLCEPSDDALPMFFV